MGETMVIACCGRDPVLSGSIRDSDENRTITRRRKNDEENEVTFAFIVRFTVRDGRVTCDGVCVCACVSARVYDTQINPGDCVTGGLAGWKQVKLVRQAAKCFRCLRFGNEIR